MQTINATFTTTGTPRPQYHHVQQGNEAPPNGTMWGLVLGDHIRVKHGSGPDNVPFATGMSFDNGTAFTLTHVGGDGAVKATATVSPSGSASFSNVEIGDHWALS